MPSASPRYAKLSLAIHLVGWRDIYEPDRVMQVAVHEAGQAVVAHALGIGVIEARLSRRIGVEGITARPVTYETEDNDLTGLDAPSLPGHSRPSMRLDVYSQVMPADEMAADQFQVVLRERG
jgi:hypothetical protein